MLYEATSINQASLDILHFQPGITGPDGFRGITRRKHPEHVFDGQPPSANDRFAAKDIRIDGNPPQQLIFAHNKHYSSASTGSPDGFYFILAHPANGHPIPASHSWRERTEVSPVWRAAMPSAAAAAAAMVVM